MSEQYTKSNLRHIAEYLVEELREMPDGTEITSGQLLKVGGYDPQEFEFSDLMDYHQYLFRAAKASHITLDMSKHENKVEGLPFNLDFVVHNKKGQIKCPYCGSKNTARILYGMPVFSDELQAKLDSGKLHLGGCCISGVRDSNGSMIALDPERYCNDCHKEFARPPYLVAKDLSDAEAYCDIVTGIKFSYGGFFMGHTEIVLKKNADGAMVSVQQFPYKVEPIPDRQITPIRWLRLVNRMYSELYIQEWKKNYDNPFVLDGEQWSLEILLTNRRKRTYQGSNDYPPYWSELKALFRPFLRR